MNAISARDRAFLEEMGIAPLWAPRGPVGPTPIEEMGWDALHKEIRACTRCTACKDGRPKVMGRGSEKAQWFVAAGAAAAQDEKDGEAVAGEAGALLANMLAAAGQSETYVTCLVKCRPLSASGGERAPSADEVAACRPYLERELALTGARTVLTLGQVAVQGLIGKPLAEARGSVNDFNGAALVATLHPGELLLRGADKALAWADLCVATSQHAE